MAVNLGSGEGHDPPRQLALGGSDDTALNGIPEQHHEPPNYSRKAEKPPVEVTVEAMEEKPISSHMAAATRNLHHRGLTTGSDSTLQENEKAAMTAAAVEEEGQKSPWMRQIYAKARPAFHLCIFLLFTGWLIGGVALHRNDLGWVVPFLVWLAITVRLITFYLPLSMVMKPVEQAWNLTFHRGAMMIPERMRLPLAATVTILIITIGAFASPENLDNTRANRAVSLFGLLVFLAGLWATSRNRAAIQWRTVIVGMLMQFVIALFVLRTGTGFDIFNFISHLAVSLLGFADFGLTFLTDKTVPLLPWFFTGVIPAIIFFVSLIQLLYYIGFLQWFVSKCAVFFFWSMHVSGAEAVVAAASPFVGQGESVMLIKPFIPHLTRAEIHQVMCSGFATIAGSVLIAYIHLGVNPQALVSSCVMSIPASLAISKIRYPEEEETLTAGRIVIPDDENDKAVNALHAFANGTWLGLKIAGMITASLLCIISLIAMLDGILGWWGHYLNINSPPLSVELLVGYLCYPIAFLLGVPRNGDLFLVSKLIGTKLVANEFVAYYALQNDPQYADLGARSRLIVTYALCGFANIGSLGNQIAVLSQLAPGRTADVSRLAVSALISGALSTFTSASIAGLLVTDQAAFFTPVNGTATA